MWQHPFRVTRTGTKAKGPARGDREPGTEDTVDGPDVLSYIFPHPMLSGRCLVDMADPSVRPIRHGEWCQNFQVGIIHCWFIFQGPRIHTDAGYNGLV